MGTTKSFSLREGTRLDQLLAVAEQNLTAQGYSVQVMPLNEVSASLNVSKDNDGIKKAIGLGTSCRATLSVQNNSVLMVNIESEWTNKIIAVAIGWFFCLVPFITGLVGCANQSSMPNKVSDALMMAASSLS